MKHIINTALLLEQLKRFWAIAAIAALGYLLLIVQLIYFSSNRMVWGMAELLTMGNGVLIFAMVTVPFCTALALFSHPYKVASAAAYHSFPMNRMQIFFTNVLAGLILILLPLLLLSIIMLTPVYAVPSRWTPIGTMSHIGVAYGDVINTFPRVIGFFFRNALGFTFYFAVFALAASLAGNRVIAVILSAFLPFVPLGIVGLGEVVGSFYLFGFGGFMGNAMTRVAILSNPVAGWTTIYGGISILPVRSHVPLAASYSVITLAVFGLAYLAYHLRPLERAGDAVAFLQVKRVLVFLLSLTGMIIMGIFWLNASNSRGGLYVGFVVGFFIAYFVAQMLAEKTFRVGHKVKYVVHYGAVALGMYMLLLIVTNIGMIGYMRRVPQSHEITGVFISQQWGRAWHGMDNQFFIGDRATIDLVRDTHQNILNERRSLQRARWGNTNLRPWQMTPFNITYRLADGSTVHRSYMLTHAFSYGRWDIRGLMQNPHVILSHSPALARPDIVGLIRFHVNLDRGWLIHSEIELARAAADAGDITLEEALGDRVYIMDFVFPSVSEVRNPSHITGLITAIRQDLESSGDRMEWQNSISFTINIHRQYHNTGLWRHDFNVPINGYAGRWLVENGFIRSWMLDWE